MHPYDLNPGSDSLQYLQISEKLLTTRDLIGSKSYATKARESDPNSEAAEQILAIVDTLIAGDEQMSSSSNQLDWYSILQLARRTHDSELIGLQYKRLGVLLNPNRNKFPFAEHAYKLVTEAWLVLSNPSRKFQFDNQFGNSNFGFNFIQTHFENPQRNSQISGNVSSGSGSGSGVHFDFMQEGSGGELHQSSSMQFVQQQQQQQQQVFVPQAITFFGEEQRQEDAQSLTSQLHWSNEGRQQLVRPQPQQPLLRPHLQQTWFEQPEPRTHIQPPLPQSQAHILQLQPHQPSHWAQNVPQPQPQPQPQSWMQQALPRPQIQQSLIEPRPPPESREQPQQPLYSSQQVAWPPPEFREQPQHLSQTVPQSPPFSQPQPWMQQSLPSPQIQTSSPEPPSQTEKNPPESLEWVNNGKQINLGENGDSDNNHENNVNVEEPSNFWTVCAYCYSMYEYSGIYADCTLRCQNCKKAFHAGRTEAPPAVADGEDAYICCWGYFPIGISLSYLEKRKAEASSWQPFSKMFTLPRGGNTSSSPQGGNEFAFPQGGNTSKPRKPRNSGPWIYIDDDEVDIFDGISSNDESDDKDWRHGPKNKKARSNLAFPIRKQPGRVAKDLGKLDGVVAQEGSVANVPDAAEVSFSLTNLPKDCGKPDGVDGVVAQEGSGVSVSDTTVVSVPEKKEPGRVAKDLGKLDAGDVVVEQEGAGVSVPEAAEVSVPTRKEPGRVAMGLDVVVAQGGSVGSIPDVDVAAVSVPARKQPGRVAKDSGKLDGVVAPEGLSVSVPDVAAPSVPVAEANKKVMGEAEKKAVGGSSKKRVSVPTRKQPGRVAKDLGKLDLNVEFNNEVEGPARGTSGGSKAVNGAEENVDGVAFFDGLDEYLSSLPILSAEAGDKAKAV